jgi:quinol monooxygenase YgiN
MGRIVIACYRPKPGKQAALRELIRDHVATLQKEKLVTDRAPITMEAADGTIVEVFEWVSKEAIQAAHTNPAVLAMWKAYEAVCDYAPIASVPEAAQLFSEFAPLEGVRSVRPPTRPPQPRRRNRFGDPTDTVYAGGTPRFDETGGQGPKRRR